MEAAEAIALILFLIWFWNSQYVIKAGERGVVMRLGKIQPKLLEPGPRIIFWPVDMLLRVSMEPQTLAISEQELVAQGDAEVRAGAKCLFRVVDAVRAISEVKDYRHALGELTKQAMQQQAGQFTVEDFQYRPETVSDGVKASLEKTAREWGLEILSLELRIEAH